MNIGLYIIGDEILSGRRQDRHLNAVVELLQARGLRLSWVAVLGDELELLERNFRDSVHRREFVLSAGGIGGTPDDLTRTAMANALGVELVQHPDALPILQRKFGDRLTLERLRMIEFPAGSELIPNPVNEIPGFSISAHHFVPGFPDMAQAMIAWVLDHVLPQDMQTGLIERAVDVVDCPESRLIPVMEEILKNFPGIKLFSLPDSSLSRRSVELGVRGLPAEAEQAFAVMKVLLESNGIKWQKPGS